MSQPYYRIESRPLKEASQSAGAALDRVVLLLAGGDGARLQELTQEIAGYPIPKQYCRLLYGSSLLEATLSRASKFVSKKYIRVIVNQNHLELAKEQLRVLPKSNIFVQPMNKDTGPGIVFALLRLARKHPDAIVAVFPTDHYISDDSVFNAHVHRAGEIVAHLPDKIAVLGIVPDHTNAAYGYIMPGAGLALPEISGKAYNVSAFMEKPGMLLAREIIASGGLWNTFVMVFRLSRMLQLLQEIVPNEFEKLAELRYSTKKAPKLYQDMDGWNFSTQVLARIPQHLVLVETSGFYWSDWGTRESIERTYERLNVVPFWKMKTAGWGGKGLVQPPATSLIA